MREEEKALTGMAFCPGHPELREIKKKTHRLNHEYNRLLDDQTEERNQILQEMLGEFGQGVFLQEPVTFHYGIHTKIGARTFINFNFTCQDDGEVIIGEDCDFGPNVTIVTPVHPLIAEERKKYMDSDGMEKRLIYAKPVKVGNSCWIGAGVVICPGVTIGDNCVIGAGSVVTRDIPSGSLAVGVPCRVLRQITESDSWEYKKELF